MKASLLENPELSTENSSQRREATVLLGAIFVIAGCGLVYELLIGSLSAYLEGDSVTHFSLTIGVFMSAMGAGSWLSRYVPDESLLHAFIVSEILLGIVGGVCGLVLFAAYALVENYLAVMTLVTFVIGTLVGLELPLLTRVFRRFGTLALTLSTVLSFDYIGALAASLAFPFVFMPHFGAVRTGLLFGLLNLAVALFTVRVFAVDLGRKRTAGLSFFTVTALCGILMLFAVSESLISSLESTLYTEEVVLAKQTRFARMVVTKWHEQVRLFLDGNLQFSSLDEYRYHEVLVHPAMLMAGQREKILVLGGGDGLACREIFRWPDVKSVTLVDIDPAVTDLATNHPDFRTLNQGAMHDPRLIVINGDARKFLDDWQGEAFDVIIADFPDPNDESLAKLYTEEFYRLLARHLAGAGTAMVQSTSPYYSPGCFSLIGRTLRSAGLQALPCHVYVPSFGEWGFHLVSHHHLEPGAQKLPSLTGLRYLNQQSLADFFHFPMDMTPQPDGESNRFERGTLLQLYQQEWKKWNQ